MSSDALFGVPPLFQLYIYRYIYICSVRTSRRWKFPSYTTAGACRGHVSSVSIQGNEEPSSTNHTTMSTMSTATQMVQRRQGSQHKASTNEITHWTGTRTLFTPLAVLGLQGFSSLSKVVVESKTSSTATELKIQNFSENSSQNDSYYCTGYRYTASYYDFYCYCYF